METERQVQYEFKVIVRADEECWPGEVRMSVEDALQFHPALKIETQSVERIRDGY